MLSLPNLNFFEALPAPLAADTSELNETTENFAAILSGISVLLQPQRADAPIEQSPTGNFAAAEPSPTSVENAVSTPSPIVPALVPPVKNEAAFAELQAAMRQLAQVRQNAVAIPFAAGAAKSETTTAGLTPPFRPAATNADTKQIFAADAVDAKLAAAEESWPAPTVGNATADAVLPSRDENLVFTTEVPETGKQKQVLGDEETGGANLFRQISTERRETVEIKPATIGDSMPGRKTLFDRKAPTVPAPQIDWSAPQMQPQQAAPLKIADVLTFDETSAKAPAEPVTDIVAPTKEISPVKAEAAAPPAVAETETAFAAEPDVSRGSTPLFQADETREKILWGAKRLIAEPTFRRLTRIKLPDEIEPTPMPKSKHAPTVSGETPPIVIMPDAPAPNASENGTRIAAPFFAETGETVAAEPTPAPVEVRPNDDLWQPEMIETPPIFDRQKSEPTGAPSKPSDVDQQKVPVKVEEKPSKRFVNDTGERRVDNSPPVGDGRFESKRPTIDHPARRPPFARLIDPATVAQKTDGVVETAGEQTLRQPETIETPPIFIDPKLETAEKKLKQLDQTIDAGWRTQRKIETNAVAPVEQSTVVELDQTDVARQIEPRLAEMAAEVERGDEKQILRMRLHPAELGTVEIKLERGADGLLEAEFVTENREAQQALNQGVEKLREALEQSGWQISRIDVTADTSGSNAGQYGDRRRQDDGREPAFGRASGDTQSSLDEKRTSNTDAGNERLVSLHA